MSDGKALAQFVIKRLGTLQRSRFGFDGHWQEIIDYILPHRSGITSQGTPGVKKMDKIYDSTATHAIYLLAAALHGMLTNPANPWFTLTTWGDGELAQNMAVRSWLQRVEQIIYDVLNGTNWNTEIHEAYLDICGFGTANLFIGKDPTRIIYFDNRSLGECYLAENHMGQVDTVFRVYSQSARQIIQEWGEVAAGKKVVELGESDPDTQLTIIHAVYPRSDRKPGNKRKENLPFASVYVLQEEERVLDEGGFEEYPYCNPRWSIMAGEVYGRSPGMIALPDVKMLNRTMEIYLRAMQKQLDPPLMVSNDGFINPVSTVPGAVNSVNSATITDKLIPFPVPGNIRAGDDMISRIQSSIRMICYNDMLQLPQGPDMTATEVLQRVEEKLRILGPVMGRFQDELLAPALVRVFYLLSRMRLLPPAPPIMRGQVLKIKYVSPLAKAQRLAQAQGISKAMEFLLPYAQFIPEAMDIINPEEVGRYVFDVYSAPVSVLRTPKDIGVMREARNKKVEQQEAQASIVGMSQAVPQLSKEPGAGSPMDFIMNQMGQEGGESGEVVDMAAATAPTEAEGVI